jgi:hypothetical protein
MGWLAAQPAFQRIGMSGSPVVNGLMVVLSITTIAVFLYPIVKLAPSWRERALHKKIIFHRQATAALDAAMARTQNDPAEFDRLAAQHARHRAALNALAPGEAVAMPEPAREIDAAA